MNRRGRTSIGSLLIGLGVIGFASHCGTKTGSREGEPQTPAANQTAELPNTGGEQPPSMAQLASAKGALLSDVDTCGGCHADVFAQQQASAHAYSSFNNPIYRTSVDRHRSEVSASASQMCAGCHDVALLADRAMAEEVVPTDDRAHAGVTCRVCHGIDEANRSGNGSYTLSSQALELPKDGDPDSVARHRKSAAPLRSSDMCGSCHRSFLDDSTGNRGVFLGGQDDLGAWLGSAYNHSGLGRIDEPIEKADCISCHMQREAAPLGDAAAKHGTVASHRFAGGHTWLASMLKDDAQLAAHRKVLVGAVSADWASIADASGKRWFPGQGAPVAAGHTYQGDLVLRNLRVGHRFPAGVQDAQDTWVEVELIDAGGRTLASAGTRHGDGERDHSAHVLRALVADENGELRFRREVHQFRAPVINHTIAARDAVVVGYQFAVPPQLKQNQWPLTLSARLIHRSRNRALQTSACDAFRDDRGQQFASHAEELGDPVLDPCGPQPLTEIAAAAIQIGPGAPSGTATWKPLWELGLALSHSRQEQVQRAREPLTLALEYLQEHQVVGRERAAVLLALGKLSGLEGRADEALEWFDRAEAQSPGHPAIAYGRGEALARVWRWAEAADALEKATSGAPDNLGGWIRRAVALGSLGRELEALDAAKRGLALSPRSADLLRVQALALRALPAAPGVASEALDAYDKHRSPDRGAELRMTCAASDSLCELERDPVHVHRLVPVHR